MRSSYIAHTGVIMNNKSRIAALLGLFLVISCLLPARALADEVVYSDDDRKDLNDASVTYIIRGNGPGSDNLHKSGNYFYVPAGTSSEDNSLTIILENVNRSQDGCNPQHSFIDICNNNYVIVKLRGTNYIKSGEQSEIGSNDGMSAISVREDATLKVTSDAGDGSTEGSLEAYGGGSKYGGAAIGRDYNFQSGSIIIAGGTINAKGGHCGAGIGSGRDGECKSITITGGDITAQGGEYAAGIGSGDNVSAGDGGDLWDLTITGGTIHATGGQTVRESAAAREACCMAPSSSAAET